MSKLRFVLIALLGLAMSLSAQEFHTPKEILAIMDKSQLRYVVTQANDSTPLPYRGGVNSAYTYQKIGPDGSRGIAQYEIQAEALDFFDAAEEAFKEKKYQEARIYYQKTLDIAPEFGIAATYIGQCFREENKLKEADEWFQKAIEINFHDYLAHWLRAEVLLNLKKKKEAVQEITVAWILNRNHPQIKPAVEKIYKASGKKFDDFEFEPRYSIEKADNEVVNIQMEIEWMMYVFCKAMWKYEPDYHSEFGGGRSEFDITEEKECLVNLIIAHQTEHGKKESKIPAINALIRATEAEMINAFIFMEIWIPIEPLIVYTQPKESIEEIAEYIQTIRIR